MSYCVNKEMLLSKLLAGIAEVSPFKDVPIKGISEYSDDVEKGDLFIALGVKDYSQVAIQRGAAVILCAFGSATSQKHADTSVPIIMCKNLSDQVNEIINRFYANETNQINTIAITGTDGKSSVAHLVAQALENSGDQCGLIGTLGYGCLKDLSESTHTTPPRSRLAKEYAKFNQIGCDFVALEASSHGIHQNRLRDLSIHTAVLTNITRDHLDYHKSMEAYIQAKAALFFDHNAKYAVINLDDEVGFKWREQLVNSLDVVSYSLNNSQADIYALNIKYLPKSTVLRVAIRDCEFDIHTTLLGEFNVLNILAVAAVLVCMQKTNDQIAVALNKLDAVPGRMQCINAISDYSVIVDYAHTPAALSAAINAVRKHCHGRVLCVFGCGGDRDKGKRAHMGEIATNDADYVVITSDNPRNEAPELIIKEIIQGCHTANNFISIVDRKKAIVHALSMAKENDAVLIAGKGHEKYQYFQDEVIAFDDVAVASAEMQRMAHA